MQEATSVEVAQMLCPICFDVTGTSEMWTWEVGCICFCINGHVSICEVSSTTPMTFSDQEFRNLIENAGTLVSNQLKKIRMSSLLEKFPPFDLRLVDVE